MYYYLRFGVPRGVPTSPCPAHPSVATSRGFLRLADYHKAMNQIKYRQLRDKITRLNVLTKKGELGEYASTSELYKQLVQAQEELDELLHR